MTAAVEHVERVQFILDHLVIEADPEKGTQKGWYTDPETEREFGIRFLDAHGQPGRDARRYFLEEYVPTGRLAEFNEKGHCVRSWEEPRIRETEARVGPNRLIATLRELEIPLDQLVKAGGGFVVGSIYYARLRDCAIAIARAIERDERYRYFRELTEQEKVRMAREGAASSHAYWSEEADASQRAWNHEAGLFKGCYTMMGTPVSEASKRAILAYLNAPSLESWLNIRGLMIAGGTTLWQAWCQHDVAAPRAGSHGHPTPDVLRAAIREAARARREEVEARLKATHPTGLRVIAT